MRRSRYRFRARDFGGFDVRRTVGLCAGAGRLIFFHNSREAIRAPSAIAFSLALAPKCQRGGEGLPKAIDHAKLRHLRKGGLRHPEAENALRELRVGKSARQEVLRRLWRAAGNPRPKCAADNPVEKRFCGEFGTGLVASGRANAYDRISGPPLLRSQS
jgi:hypothetical protein